MALPNRNPGEYSEGVRYASSGNTAPFTQHLKIHREPEIGGAVGLVSPGEYIPLTPAAPFAFTSSHPQNQPSRLGSVAYMAVIRRRESQSIKALVAELAKEIDRPDLVMSVPPIIAGIRGALDRIADADLEGNSREILRRLRDTLLNGGWNNYRNRDAVLSAVSVLDHLSRADHVTPVDVKTCTARLHAAGLKTLDVALIGGDEEELSVDDESD